MDQPPLMDEIAKSEPAAAAKLRRRMAEFHVAHEDDAGAKSKENRWPEDSKPGGGRRAPKTRSLQRAVPSLREMCDRLAPDLEDWIRAAAARDPARGAELTLRAMEFHLPRLSPLNIDLKQIPIEEIAVELERREAS